MGTLLEPTLIKRHASTFLQIFEFPGTQIMFGQHVQDFFAVTLQFDFNFTGLYRQYNRPTVLANIKNSSL